MTSPWAVKPQKRHVASERTPPAARSFPLFTVSTDAADVARKVHAFFSDKADRFDRSVARQAEMLEGLLARLEVDRATIVGHGIGGAAALRLAALFPFRVRKLVLVGASSHDACS